MIYKVDAKYSIPKKILPVSALAVLNQQLVNNQKQEFDAKIIYKFKFLEEFLWFSCKASQEFVRNANLNIKQKEERRAANVTVIAIDVMDVNWSKVSKKLKSAFNKQKLAEIIEKNVTIIEAERERLSKTPILHENDEISVRK